MKENKDYGKLTWLDHSCLELKDPAYKGTRARIMRKIRSCKPFKETLVIYGRYRYCVIERKRGGTPRFTVTAHNDAEYAREFGYGAFGGNDKQLINDFLADKWARLALRRLGMKTRFSVQFNTVPTFRVLMHTIHSTMWNAQFGRVDKERFLRVYFFKYHECPWTKPVTEDEDNEACVG